MASFWINGVIAEISYICCFTRIVKDFEEEKVRLEVERKTVKQRVDVATERGRDVQANVLFWEEEADKLIQEDTRTKQKCFFGFCSHCIWRYKRGKDLTNKIEQMKRLMEKGDKLDVVELRSRPPPDVERYVPSRLPPPDVERYSSHNYIPFKSRESKYKEVLDALYDDNNYIVGLQGMGGIGKTTLAKQVGMELKQAKLFTCVILTTVSHSPDIRKIQDDIAGPLGLEWDDCRESDRPKKIWSRLTNGEKILLILDDVWDQHLLLDFYAIGIPERDNHGGCRVLVTTRNILVCHKLDCDNIIQLDLLSEEDAWIMFQRHAGLSEISTKKLLDKGRKIAKECQNLPIAIAAIANSLKGKGPEEWDAALYSLQQHMHMNAGDGEHVEIYRTFKVSYDNLKNEKTKRLFLMCSVFQKDEEIPIEMLSRLGIGAGLFEIEFGNYNDSRIQVVVSKNKLIASGLLMEAGRNIVKMNQLVRDAAQWIANKEIQTIKLYDQNQNPTVELNKNIKYLLCEGKANDVFSCKLDDFKLEILIVTVHKNEDCHNVKIEVPDSFFKNNNSLRVFHLSYDHYPKLNLSLHQSIHLLKNIRSLLFTLVNLGDISILGNLESLETLDLKDCKIDELPHGIANLGKFRLLNLEGCKIVRNNPFEVLERCSSLEELYFTGSFNDFCREIIFPKLQRFCIDEFPRPVNDTLTKYVSVIDKDEVFLSETTLKYCMQTAEVLRLRRIKRGWRNLIPEIVSMDQGMNDIVELSLSFISQIQYLVDTKRADIHVPNVLSNLVVLELDRMKNLKELFNGLISLDSLENLEKLSIKDCKHLRNLFKFKLNLCNLKTIKLQSCPMLVSLYQLLISGNLVVLETLEIVDCERLKNITIADERREEESREEIDDGDNNKKCLGSMFPKLEVLHIEGCPLLESIFSFLFVQDFPVLETIKIRRCDELKYIFGQYQHVEFSSLRQLELCQLPNFIDMFCKSNHLISLPETGSSSNNVGSMKWNIFSWDIATTTMPLLDEHYSESNSFCLNIWERAQCLQIPSTILCNIKKIELSHFSKIKSVFIPSIAPRMLLETLTIRNCDKLKNIIDFGDYDSGSNNWGNVFPKLKELYIEDCPQMKYIFEHYIDDHQNHVEIQLHLLELKCLSLCNLPSLVAMCPKYYRIIFPPLEKFKLYRCSDAAIKSMSHFIIHRVSESLDKTIIQEVGDGQIALTESVTSQDIDDENWEETSNTDDDQVSQNDKDIESNIAETKMKSIAEGKKEFVENLDELLNEQSKTQFVATKQKGIKISDEEGTTSTYGQTITSSTHSKSLGSSLGPLATSERKTSSPEYGDKGEDVNVENLQKTSKTNDDKVSLNNEDQFPKDVKFRLHNDDQIAATSFSIATTKTDDQVSRNDAAVKNESSNVKDKIPKNNEVIVPKSPFASQFPLVPSKGDPSKKVEDLSSSLLVKTELELLVSKKHLDYENMSLLTDFLRNHPSVLLRDTSLSNKYKGYAYNCLAELLKFLKTHSVLEVLGSCQTEFVELLQAANSFAFDKDWLDGIKRRTLFLDLQVSQDALQKLSVSKQLVTKDVEALRLKIEDLKQQLISSEATLENIIQQEADLSAPIGY